MEAEALARRIHARRVRDGMLVLDLPEVDLVHDEEGNVAAVKPSDGGFSHTIIEMFMVEANEAVARLLACIRKRVKPNGKATVALVLRPFSFAVAHCTLEGREVSRLLETARKSTEPVVIDYTGVPAAARAN